MKYCSEVLQVVIVQNPGLFHHLKKKAMISTKVLKFSSSFTIKTMVHSIKEQKD